MPKRSTEEPLSGGNVSHVVRVGQTVRRSAGPWTSTVQGLLAHVRDRGVTFVPEPQGFDDAGREVLSFIPGVVPHQLPDWIWSEPVLEDCARTLRQWHDATAGYRPADAVWGLRARAPREVVCHNDFAPYNTVFRGRRLVGLIDFDACAPGPRLWDMAYVAYRFVPLMPPPQPSLAPQGSECSPFQWEETLRRLKIFLTVYAAKDGRERCAVADCIETAAQRIRALADWTDEHGACGDRPELLEHARVYREHAEWLDSK